MTLSIRVFVHLGAVLALDKGLLALSRSWCMYEVRALSGYMFLILQI